MIKDLGNSFGSARTAGKELSLAHRKRSQFAGTAKLGWI